MTKPLVTITVTLSDGSTFTLDDSLDSADASMALNGLMHGEWVLVSTDDSEVWVNPNAVVGIEVTTSESDEIPVIEPCAEGGE